MSRQLIPQPLTAAAFAPFGDVLQCDGTADKIINQGMCERFHDKASCDFADGHAGISIFNAQSRQLPLTLDMVERHPLGSQAFLPMHQHPYLVIVAENRGTAPDKPIVFVAAPGQGVNYHRNTWHGVLCPLHDPGLFAVVDRIGDGSNLEEHWFDDPWIIMPT